MRLINKTKNSILAEDVFIAKTLFSRIKGLLGKRSLLPKQGIILEPCNSIHTFFMCFSIDVIFVDRSNKIVKTLPKFIPNRISPIYWHSQKVVELPAGTLDASNTQILDQLELSD